MINQYHAARTGSPGKWTASMAVLAAGLLFSAAAQAQEAAAEPVMQEPVALEPVAEEPVAQDVTAEGQADIVVQGRFLDTGASSATKLDIPVLDTPFSVASYSDDFLEAIETSNISDLYKYMNGIQRAGNTGYDITFRGFKTSGNDRNAILTDGLPGLSVRFGSPPTVGVDHIELVKGATSVLYGQAQPGGFLNIISKKPSARRGFEMTAKGVLGVGTYDRALAGTIAVDATGPLTSDDRLLYRFVGEIGGSRGFREDSYELPIYVAPSLSWQLGDRTTITLQGEYRRVKTHYDTSLVAPNRNADLIADIDTSYQEERDFLIERGTIGSVFVNHEFNDWLKFNLGYRYVDHIDTQTNFDVVGFRNPTTITRRARGQENIRTYSFGDANLTAKFETLGIRHTLLVGLSGGRETASLNRTQFFNCTGSCTALDLNIYNPVRGVVPRPSAFPLDASPTQANLTWRYTTQNSFGAYASDLIEFSDMFKVMVGVRYADESQTIEDLRRPDGVTRKADNKVLPLAGIVFQPRPNISLYASYSTSFVPVAAASQDNFGQNPFKPTEAKAYEAGIKTELLDRKLNITAAYFDIRKTNTLNSFSCLTEAQLIAAGIPIPPGATIASGTCSNQLGGERSRGFEIEFNASPLDNWQLTGGYAHTTARVTSSNIASQNGARLTNSPDDAFNLWSRYDFEEGALANLGIGLGISHIGKRTGLLPTTVTPAGAPEGGTLPLRAYTTVDLGLYYKASENIDFTLKATNLFDERYLESAGFSGDIQLVPGTPRQLTATARLSF